MPKKSLSYESISKHYAFCNDPNSEDPSIKNIIKRANELREAGWVAVPGTFSLDAPQQSCATIDTCSPLAGGEPDIRMNRSLVVDIKTGTPRNGCAVTVGGHRLLTPHGKVNALRVSGRCNVLSGSVFGVEPSGSKGDIGEIGIDTTLTSDPEGKNRIGVSMTTYLDGSYGGLSLEEWLKLDGKTYPIGTPIWSDWGKDLDILIDPKQGA